MVLHTVATEVNFHFYSKDAWSSMNKPMNFIDICDFNQNRLISLSMKTSKKKSMASPKNGEIDKQLVCSARKTQKFNGISAGPPVASTNKRKKNTINLHFSFVAAGWWWLRAEGFDSRSRMNRNKKDYSISIMKGASHVTGKNIFALLWLSQFPPVYIFIGCTAGFVRAPSLPSANSTSLST